MASGHVRERLHQAIARQRRLAPKGRRRSAPVEAHAVFQPVSDAASELRDELSKVADLEITIEPDSVWIELYDKHFWFGYDAERRVFVGVEEDALWMEGGVREEAFSWDNADACVEAMIQACARYVALANAIARLHPGG